MSSPARKVVVGYDGYGLLEEREGRGRELFDELLEQSGSPKTVIAGRREVWVPARWRRKRLDGAGTQAFVERLVRLMQRLERLSRPRARWALHHRIARPMFGATIIVLSLAAFLAPPFSVLDTLPALGAVIVSLGVLLEDAAVGCGHPRMPDRLVPA